MEFSKNIYAAYCRGWAFGQSAITIAPDSRQMIVSVQPTIDAIKQETLAYALGVKHARSGEGEPRWEKEILEQVSNKLEDS